MPFTPFHMGPGLALKAVGGRHVSLLVFGLSQVAMDVEPLFRIIRGDAVLHGFSHTYLGATLVALVSGGVGGPISRILLRLWAPDPSARFLSWLRDLEHVSWTGTFVSALAGTYSHVVLDGIMHADLQPLAPFSAANALLGVVSVGVLHLLCVLAGALGTLALYALFGLRSRTRAGALE